MTLPPPPPHTAPIPLRPSKLAPMLEPVHAFLSAESAGGMVLMATALAALVLANSPWRDNYHNLWHAELSVAVAGRAFAMSLAHWVNDGLMVVFFLLVGLEIKRELVMGELASPRRAALPIAAAVGGMVVPALLYLAFTAGGAGRGGWGIPMATDIAFAVGVLALVGRAVPVPMKVFLLAVAIVDDLGAVLVIAFFYTGELSVPALAIAGTIFAALLTLNVLRVHSPLPYILLGIGLWAATLASGLHATIAGVLLALTIPATRQIEEHPYLAYARRMLDRFERDATVVPDRITDEQSHAIKALEEASQAVQTPLARVEHALLMPVNFLIVPLFALANAGVEIGTGAALGSPVTWGVVVGLLIGKPLGVLLASWAAVAAGLAQWPPGATRGQMVGVAILCGIGFTMSLFVANLAFPGPDRAQHLAAAKIGILAASLAAGVAGGAILAWCAASARRASSFSTTAPDGSPANAPHSR